MAQKRSDICQAFDSTKVCSNCDNVPVTCYSDETYYTARSREASIKSSGVKRATNASGTCNGQTETQHNCEQTADGSPYRLTQEEDNKVMPGVMSYNQCSHIDDQMVQSQHKTPSLTSHCCPEKVTRQMHVSNVSLPGSKSIASSKRSHTPKSCRSNHIGSQNTSMLSEGVVCRICHEGDTSEVLVSPCYCSGSMGLIHVSCLQTWLGSSNKTTCEICNFQFSLVRKTMPIIQFLRNPGTSQDRRNFICDVVSFLIITPLTMFVVWICLQGARHHYSDSELEQGGLISLSVCLLLLYSIWLAVAIRHNWRLWKDWKMFHQEVTLLCVPSTSHNKSETMVAGSRNNSHSRLGSVQLQSVRINVYGPLTQFKKRKEKQTSKLSKYPQKIPNVKKKSSSRADTSHTHKKTAQGHQQSEHETIYQGQGQGHGHQCEEHRNHACDHFDHCTTYFRNPRKKYAVESKHSSKVSNRSSSEQSSLNAVYEHHELECVRSGYRHTGSYKDKHRRYQCVCDGGSDTGRSTGSYPTSGEYIPDRSRPVHYNPVYIYQPNRSDHGPVIPTNRPVLDKETDLPMAIFSRGGSPNDDKSHDYIAKWVNEHTNGNECGYDRNKLESRETEYSNSHQCRNKTTCDKNGQVFQQERNSSSTNNSKCETDSSKNQPYANTSKLTDNDSTFMYRDNNDSRPGDNSVSMGCTERSHTPGTAVDSGIPDSANAVMTNTNTGPNNNLTDVDSKLSVDLNLGTEPSAQSCSLIDVCTAIGPDTAECLDNSEEELIL